MMQPTSRAPASQYSYIWEYEVDPDRIAEFLDLYEPNGKWSLLFRRSPDYLRTELHRDRAQSNRFVTIDYWTSFEAWQAFREHFAAEFEDLDRRGDALTHSEREVGRFSTGASSD